MIRTSVRKDNGRCSAENARNAISCSEKLDGPNGKNIYTKHHGPYTGDFTCRLVSSVRHGPMIYGDPFIFSKTGGVRFNDAVVIYVITLLKVLILATKWIFPGAKISVYLIKF